MSFGASSEAIGMLISNSFTLLAGESDDIPSCISICISIAIIIVMRVYPSILVCAGSL